MLLQSCRKIEKPVSAGRRRAFWILLVRFLGQPGSAEVRRHARHVMMVVMTMMDANLHLFFSP